MHVREWVLAWFLYDVNFDKPGVTTKTLRLALRLKRFEADEKARKVADLERMVREFENIAADLDRQIRRRRISASRIPGAFRPSSPNQRDSAASAWPTDTEIQARGRQA